MNKSIKEIKELYFYPEEMYQLTKQIDWENNTQYRFLSIRDFIYTLKEECEEGQDHPKFDLLLAKSKGFSGVLRKGELIREGPFVEHYKLLVYRNIETEFGVESIIDQITENK